MKDRTGLRRSIWCSAWRNSPVFPVLETAISWDLSYHFDTSTNDAMAALLEISQQQLKAGLISKTDFFVVMTRGRMSLSNGQVTTLDTEFSLQDILMAISCWRDMMTHVRHVEFSIFLAFKTIWGATFSTKSDLQGYGYGLEEAGRLALDEFATELRRRYLDSEEEPMNSLLEAERIRKSGREYLFVARDPERESSYVVYRTAQTDENRYRFMNVGA